VAIRYKLICNGCQIRSLDISLYHMDVRAWPSEVTGYMEHSTAHILVGQRKHFTGQELAEYVCQTLQVTSWCERSSRVLLPLSLTLNLLLNLACLSSITMSLSVFLGVHCRENK
jgi:hypothetical protein